VTTHPISPEQHADLTALDCKTTLSVARAYRACRQRGSDHHAGMLAAIQAYHAAQPGGSDTDARHAAILIIAGAAREAPGWFWHGVGAVPRGAQTTKP
jgi:hypothetical protein